MVAQFKPQVLPDDLNGELIRISRLLEGATDEYHEAALEFAVAEDGYRHAKATSYLAAVVHDKTLTRREARTIPSLEATRDLECQDERQRAYLARANKEGARERVLSLRAQLSALQSVASSIRAELELTRTGPR